MTTVKIDAETSGGDADVRADPAMGTTALPGRDALDRATLADLSRKSDAAGLIRLAGHMTAIACAATLVTAVGDSLWLRLPAMVLLGFTITTLFAPMHECVHATPFASRRLNRLIGWITGAAVGWNATYYRRFHAWHHRYTQDPDNDPELRTPKPTNRWEYLKRLSGLPYYRMQMLDLWRCATGRIGHLPFIPARGIAEIRRSALLQFGLYGAVVLCSVLFQSWAVITFWLLPMIMAQPLMRIILLAEHTGCSEERNGLTNTRTTMASMPVRFLMWNMPFHAEHHLYPSTPFHALPKAHQLIKARLTHISESYPSAHRDIQADIRQPAA
ncbi:MAG: fatty acid desaturase [Alphaproteobacteria bacterium]